MKTNLTLTDLMLIAEETGADMAAQNREAAIRGPKAVRALAAARARYCARRNREMARA